MATITFSSVFQLALSPKQLLVNDLSDYAGQGISTSDVNGCIKLVSPSGITIYDNIGSPTVGNFSNADADIRNSVASNNLGRTVIALPIDTDTGYPELGDYEVTYQVYNSDTEEFYDAETKTYTNEYVAIEGSILQTADCVSPQFVSRDTTDYRVNGVTPSIDGTHTLIYPATEGVVNAPTVVAITGANTVITRGLDQFFQGVQTTNITVALTYVFGDGLVIVDNIVTYQNFTVDCVDLCGIICCVKKLRTKVITACCNETEFKLYWTAMALITDIQLNVTCGTSAGISAAITYLKTFLNCEDGCNDCGTAGSPIHGIGSILNNVVVDTDGSPIEVRSVVAGDLTTYYVKLSDSFVTQVNNLVTDVASLFILTTYLQLEFDAIKDTMTTVTGSGQADVTLAFGVCSGAIVYNAGSGYAVNDVCTVLGGTGTAAEITVTAVSGGVITGYEVTNQGSYSVLPTNPVTTSTGGGGVGATFNLYWNQNFNVDVEATKWGNAGSTGTTLSTTSDVYLTADNAYTTANGEIYLYWFEADYSLFDPGMGGAFSCDYFPVVNGVNVNIDGGGSVRQLYYDNVDADMFPGEIYKMVMSGWFVATGVQSIRMRAEVVNVGNTDIRELGGKFTMLKVG